MKILSIPKTNYDSNCSKTKEYSQNLNTGDTKNNVAFRGIGSAFKNGATNSFKFIERAGFFIEFLIVDTLSMILPRVIVGLNRDKEKTGKWNYKAGAEEALRESLSGPSMNLIPMGILAAFCAFKPAARSEKAALEGLNSNMSELIDKMPDIKNKKALDKALASKLFEEAFGDKDIDSKLRKSFIDILTESPDTKKKLFNNEVFKNNMSQFEQIVNKINNTIKAKSAPDSPDCVTININKNIIENNVKLTKKTPISVSAASLYEDFGNYSRDITEKLTKASFVENSTKEAKHFLSNLQKTRIGLKFAMGISSFIAVGTFLLYLPKFYQLSKTSPAEESAKLAAQGTKGGINENK